MSNKELQCIDSLSVCCTADRGPSDAAETQQHEDFVSRIEAFIKKLSFFGLEGWLMINQSSSKLTKWNEDNG